MKSSKLLFISLGVLVLLNITLVTFLIVGKSDPIVKKGEKKPPREHRMEHFLKKRLELSEEQLKQFNESKRAHFEFVEGQRSQLKRLNRRYFKCISTPDCDDKEQLMNKIQATHANMLANRYTHFEQVLNLVEGDKKEKLKRMLIRMSSMGPRGRKGPHGERPEGRMHHEGRPERPPME